MSKVPVVLLSNGQTIPGFGLGTYQGPPGKEAEVGDAVKLAIDVGYRLFDCAHVYKNEKVIGDAIAAKIAEGVVKREDLFVTSKLWNTCHRPDLVEGAIKNTLKNLGLEYVDLYLMHWPYAYKVFNAISALVQARLKLGGENSQYEICFWIHVHDGTVILLVRSVSR